MFAISIMTSCTKSSSVGSELLAGDQANIEFTDTLTLRMATIKEDSVKVYDPFSPFSSYLLGDFMDPIFGGVDASIYGQVRSGTVITTDFSTATLDSIYLSLAYDADGLYGKANETYTVSVYRLTKDMDATTSYYSNKSFAFDPTPLATINFIPDLSPIIDTLDNGDLIELQPLLRIPLDAAFGNEILSQPDSVITNDANFVDYFKGFYIKAESTTESMLSFDLSSGRSALSVHFTTDTTQHTFSYSFNSSAAKMTHIEHSFSTDVETSFNDFATGNNILYLQALAGPNVQIEFPYANKINNAIINKAELEFTISVQDTSDFPSPEQIIVATRDTDGTYLILEDVSFALNRGVIALFGGQVEEATSGEIRKVYKMNIAGAFQDMADGLINESLYLRILPKQEQISRVTFFGPGHSLYPAKLNLTYTRLNE